MTLRITRTAAAAVRRGHPWVYREGIQKTRQRMPAMGATVELADEEGTFLGRGLYDAASPIAVRVFDATRGPALSTADLGARVARAVARRDGRFDAGTTAYRLCNGEGDRVPGMVIDRYGDVAVLRLDTEAWGPHLAGVARALVKPLAARGVRSIAVRVTFDDKKLDPLEGPPPPDRIQVLEHGMTMEVDLAHGQKTGAFLDQRENRARVRALAAGRKRVLNLFSYAGGFSIAAALGGAERVTSVDVAAAAHATAQRTFRANGVDPLAHAFVSADVFAFLDQARTRGDRFDLIISDPPSFAPSERALPRAMQAYRKLHGAVASVLADGGVLCASSCSSHVDAEDFVATLDDAALGRGDLRLCDLFGNPEDHPSLPAWPEGRYLKFAVLS
ncbi:LSU m5C1962 methyltransferase RlmI [Minicystis rosea]|nr:LSU m5C1962 methyltransferase RlmI [Minicystis rosea]